MLLEYLEGWLNGRGAKGIDTLASKPGIHPALMEDLATARTSVAQIAQRIRHAAKDTSTGLPVECYSDQEVAAKAEQIYLHIFNVYTSPSSFAFVQ